MDILSLIRTAFLFGFLGFAVVMVIACFGTVAGATVSVISGKGK